MKRLIITTATLLLWTNTVSAQEEEQKEIYTSVYPLQFIIEEIGGDTVDVNSIIPPGADAHSYEPTMQDMTTYAGADMFVFVGGNMETFSETIASALSGQSVEMIQLSDYPELFITSEDVSSEDVDETMEDHDHGDDDGGHGEHEHGEHDHDHSEVDPHIWISPLKMIDVATILKREMIALYPEEEALYTENYELLVEDLETLDADFRETLEDKKNGHIIVPHAAFGYWSEYGITQIPLSGYSMSEEPSQSALQELVVTAEEYKLAFVLLEQNVESRLPEVIQNEIDAEARQIHNLEVRLPEEVEEGLDYLDLMYRNLEVLDEVTE